MSEPFDPAEIFVDVAKDSAATLASEAIKQELQLRGFSEVFLQLSGETAKTLTGALIGPLLSAFLKVLDPTQRKLDRVLKLLLVGLSNPLTTGRNSARLALSMNVQNENDAALRINLFNNALSELERAYSNASNQGRTDEAIRIRLTQAVIAKHLNSPGGVENYVKEYKALYDRQVTHAQQKLKKREATLRHLEFLRTPEGINELEARRKQLLAAPPPISQAERRDGAAGFKLLGWNQAISDLTAVPTEADIAEAFKNVEAAKQELLKRLAFGKFLGLPVGQESPSEAEPVSRNH